MSQYLLTPGPLTTDLSVREAMLVDHGSWDDDFRRLSRSIRESILALIDNTDDTYECVLMQGSGTFVVEAMLGTLLPHDSHSLVLINGAYGKRIAQTLEYLGRSFGCIDKGDYLPPQPSEVLTYLNTHPQTTHVVMVHCETSSGILNPINEIAAVAASFGVRTLIDSMSAFGAIPVDLTRLHCDALVSSANKCIEGAPGFGFVIVKRSVLEASAGRSHSLSLDLHAQWKTMRDTGQWRFTPPTHVVAAFAQALLLHQQEGGVAARGQRYATNRATLVNGMQALGFQTLLSDQWLSPIIVTFFCPADQQFKFASFYDGMKTRGFIVYPGKLTEVESFRIGCIGAIDSSVMAQVVQACADTLADMGVTDASPPSSALQARQRLLDASA